MRFILFLSTLLMMLGYASASVHAQSCGGGFVTYSDGIEVCNPVNCNPIFDSPCNCSISCQGVTLIGEYCSDYRSQSSCNSINFSGKPCGNRGSCSWSGGSVVPTNTPRPTNTPIPGVTNTPGPAPTDPPAGCAHWCATAGQCSASGGNVVAGSCSGTDVCCQTGGTPPPPAPYCCGSACPGANGNCCGHPWYGNCSSDSDWANGFWRCRDNTGGSATARCSCSDTTDPKGVHDATTCQVAATGWACDYDYNGPMRIRVLVNDQGTTRVIYDGPTTINRPDVQAAGECQNLDSGYSIPMPVQYMDGISRNFWVEFPTDYSSCGDTRNLNSPTAAFNSNRTISCPPPTPTAIGLPTYCQINGAVVGGVNYTGSFSMNVGETANFTYFGGGPSVVRSALYSSPVSTPNNWTTLGSGSAVNNSNFTCTTAGQFQVVCNSLRSDNSIACSGNPWYTAFPDCGPQDALTVTCRAAACNPTMTVTPSGHVLDVGGPAQNFAIGLANTTGCTGLAVTSRVENLAVATSTGLVTVGTNQYRYPVSAVAPGNTRVRVDMTNNGQPITTLYGDVVVSCTPPDAPVSFTATDANFRIRLRWTNNDPTVTGFRILRGGAVVATVPVGVASPPNYVISGNQFTYFDDAPGLCGTAHNYSIVALNSNRPACSESTLPATAIGRCDNYEAWFGVGGGGSLAAGNGDVRSRIPNWAPVSTPPLPVFPPTYISANDANSDRPGYVMGGGLLGFSGSQANSRGYVAGGLPPWTSIITRNENSYISMLDRATTRADARLVNQSSIANQGNWNSMVNSGGPSNTVTLLDGRQVRLVRNQLGGGTMTIDLGQSDRTLNIPSPVLLFVDGNVQINNLIDVNPNSFLAIIASGNINVSPAVGDSGTYVELQSGVPVTLNYNPNTGSGVDMRLGSYQAHIEGIFFAGGSFGTGGIDTALANPAPYAPGRYRSLRIDGSVIGMTGVSLQREVRGPYPSIYVNFRPDFVYVLHQIGLRRKIYQELLSP